MSENGECARGANTGSGRACDGVRQSSAGERTVDGTAGMQPAAVAGEGVCVGVGRGRTQPNREAAPLLVAAASPCTVYEPSFLLAFLSVAAWTTRWV